MKRSMSLPSLSSPEAYEPKRNASWTPRIDESARRRAPAMPAVRRTISRTGRDSSVSLLADHSRRLPRRRLWTRPASSIRSSARWTGCASAFTRRAISRVCNSWPGVAMSKARTSRAMRPVGRSCVGIAERYHDCGSIDHNRGHRGPPWADRLHTAARELFMGMEGSRQSRLGLAEHPHLPWVEPREVTAECPCPHVDVIVPTPLRSERGGGVQSLARQLVICHLSLPNGSGEIPTRPPTMLPIGDDQAS